MHRGAVLSAAIEAFLPSTCLSCDSGLAGGERGLCTSCWSRVVPLMGSRCRLCGGPSGDTDDCCLSCTSSPPPQNGTVIWGEHAGVLRRALLAFKHGGHDEVVEPLARRLATLVSLEGWASELEAVTAVPSHRLHRLRRGWSAASLLAAEVARRLDLPYARHLKRRGLARQARRSRAQLLRLPARSFAARKSIQGSHVLLIDDVMTTGTTLRRASAALLAAGADSVHCAVLAYSPDFRRMS